MAGLLLLLMVIGSLCLWVAVPAAVLWALGELVSDRTEHLILGLIAVPVGMALFGLFLAVLNTAFLRASGVDLAMPEDESEWRPRLRGPLDQIIRISAVVCLLAFLAWLVFGSGGVGPLGGALGVLSPKAL